MEVGVSDPNPNPVRVKRKTLEAMLEQCQRALELINASDGQQQEQEEEEEEEDSDESHPSTPPDPETDQLCDLIKSRVECPDFLEKLEHAQASVSLSVVEEGGSWDFVNENDLWEGEEANSDQEDYVLVKQEDIVEGIACFMAAYLLSLKQTKDLTPNQLQDGYIKILLLQGLPLKHFGLLAKLYQSYCDLPMQLEEKLNCSKLTVVYLLVLQLSLVWYTPSAPKFN
ncbi:uncharacterized protein LOC114193178 isoform X1 [Vigna unguiculata]|uniref:uncharacterized protein LOC114193178 isoform X1 n=1 Tax=Vigna unguiculata TaxID=3917 RepID=UPI001016DCAD|nr:uncharacterized protein LOC114193178 isoform X1 [Vigna unguiculata]